MFAVIRMSDKTIVWTTPEWEDAQHALVLENHWEYQTMGYRASSYCIVYID